MNGRDLESLYAAAVCNVRQPHLDRLRGAGVMPATIARLGTTYPPFGVLTGQVEASGRFLPGDGQAHVVQPVVESCALVDLVAWRVANPARWGLVNDLGWMLNADTCFASRWDGSHLSLCSTPLQWLRADAVGGVVLDWDSSDLCWLRGFERINCDNDMLAATLRRSLTKPTRLPAIRSQGVQHVA